MNKTINNNLGIRNSDQMREIEYYLFNIKYHLIDDSFTFDEDSLFTTKYLEKVHKFLFGDIYSEEMCEISSTEAIKEANLLLAEIQKTIIYAEIEHLGDQIYELWKLQLFHDGNTRTLLCFLKVVSQYYDFNITYDFTKDVTKDYFINEVIDSIKSKNKSK